MGMFSFELEITVSCPVCDASTTCTREQNVNGKAESVKAGDCNVCGWEREFKPSRDRDAIHMIYVSIPKEAIPRTGVQLLSENGDVSIRDAADVLNPDTSTTFDDVKESAQTNGID